MIQFSHIILLLDQTMTRQRTSFIFLLSLLIFSGFASATDLKIGDKAPNFKLQATNGEYYQLSDYLGKQAVVLAWYPMANTRGCTMNVSRSLMMGT